MDDNLDTDDMEDDGTFVTYFALCCVFYFSTV